MLRFHDGKELLGNLLGTADAGRGTFWLRDPVAIPSPHGKAEAVEPGTDGAVFAEGALEFSRQDRGALVGIRLQTALRDASGKGLRTGLHFLVDDEEVLAGLRGCNFHLCDGWPMGGKQRSAKGEAVEFAFDAQAASRSPDLVDAEGNAQDGPAAEFVLQAFERGFEGFRDGLGRGFLLHGSCGEEEF